MPFRYNLGLDKIQAPAPAYITNYPAANLSDGTELKLIAAELDRPYRYVNTQGAVRTIKAYDFGLPFAGRANKTNITIPSKDLSREALQNGSLDSPKGRSKPEQ